MNKVQVALASAAASFLLLPTVSLAADGKNEFTGSLSYTDVEDLEITMADLSWGHYLTDMHEIGFTASYVQFDAGDFGSLDGTTLGGFYHLNFGSEGSTKPFIGINADWVGGDLGDAFDFGYGATAGFKVYPWDNAGFVFAVSYQELQGASGYSNSNSTSVSFGVLVRF